MPQSYVIKSTSKILTKYTFVTCLMLFISLLMLLVFVLSTCVLYLHVLIVLCQISWKFCRNKSCWNTSTIFRKLVYFHRKNYGIRMLQWNGRSKYLKSRKLTNDDSTKTLILCTTNVYKTLLVHVGREIFLYMLWMTS